MRYALGVIMQFNLFAAIETISSEDEIASRVFADMICNLSLIRFQPENVGAICYK